jgi:hypothetical protein
MSQVLDLRLPLSAHLFTLPLLGFDTLLCSSLPLRASFIVRRCSHFFV